MDETSGKVEKAGTHSDSFIVMYLAVVEIHHCAVANIQATALPNKEKTGHGKFIQRGDG